MERINEQFLTDIRNTIRVINVRTEAKKQQLLSKLIKNIKQSDENHTTKREAINRITHVQTFLDNSETLETILLEYPTDVSPSD